MGFVNRNSAFSIEYSKITLNKNISFRFALTIEATANVKKEVVVIMKNPSSTCLNLEDGIDIKTSSLTQLRKSRIDRTTGYVYRFLKKYYERIIILNLYPFYTPKPNKVNAFYRKNYRIESLAFNDLFIYQLITKHSNADIVCAWGKPNGINKPDYNKRIEKITAIIGKRSILKYDETSKQLVPYSYNQKDYYPLHGLKWR